jgi:prepilin-type N-terminal cleavage/methylation domain-containing protein
MVPTERKAAMATARISPHGSRALTPAGFSLLELTIVLVLIGLVAVVVAPSFAGGLSGLQLETSGRNLVTLLKHARTESVGKQKVFRVVLEEADHGSGTYFLTNDFGELIKRFELPDGYTFEVPHGERLPLMVSFYPNGRSSGGEFALKNRQGKRIPILVDSITGYAKVKRQEKPDRR